MLIGELADAVGLPSATIRFYERRGLLPAPAREANDYRVYPASTITRLAFIRAAQAAGLTLVEIASIVELRDHGQVPCHHVSTLLQDKLAVVRARRRELAKLEADLRQLIARGRDLDPADCTDTDICHLLAAPGPQRPARHTWARRPDHPGPP